MTEPILFHFDFLSPYAYLAWHGVQPIASRHRRTVRVVPTLLAPLLSNGATKGPAEIPAKRKYVFVDAWRGAHKIGLTLRPPPSHPFNPLLALRTVCAAEQAQQGALVTALFNVAWGGERHDEGGLEHPAVVARVADAAGLDGAALVAAAQTDAVKSVLKSNTAAAIAADVFGVPTMRTQGALFWGFDALDYLDAFLDGKDPVPPALLEQWSDLPASARRPGADKPERTDKRR